MVAMAMTTMAADSGISHCSFLGHENGHAQRPFELPSPRAYAAVHGCGDAVLLVVVGNAR
jgi:hypothetical protein